LVWTIELTDVAKRQLRKLDRQNAQRITDFFDKRIAVQSNPRATGRALMGPFAGLWRYRVGDFRMICEIHDSEIMILVIEIGDRKDVYR
jgi:mRNA interferase RelE/StbE